VLLLAPASRAGEPIDLKVLYAGHSGSDREKDFKAFLAEHFAQVGATDYEKFTPEQAKAYDVVILDWTSIEPRDEKGNLKTGPGADLNLPKPPKLAESYDRPTILIGAGGGYAIRPSKLKIDWHCLCLDDAAHGIKSSHDIFQTPFKINLQLEDRPVPTGYRHYPGGDELGSTIKVWKVQTRMFPVLDPGLVSDPYGFADSPDAEIISAGLNGKGPDSVALGRQGNYFLWGFSASPTDLTPEGRKCLVNSVCYIKRFEGQKPLVKKTGNAREWILVDASWVELYYDQDLYTKLFSEDVRKRFGKDFGKYLPYYKENLEYLQPWGESFAVDEDVKGLGLSNRKVELLDTCVSMLEQGDRPDLARRVLERYTTERFPDAAGWRTWLKANRRRLFFTDSGGFKFLVAPESLIGPASLGRSARLMDDSSRKPDRRNPVVAEAELSALAIRRGDQAVLTIRVETAPTWHIYAVEGSGGPAIATVLRLELPKGVEAEGEWFCPKPIKSADGQMVYEGELEFRRKLRVGSDAALGSLKVACELGYQACDPFSCHPPTKTELIAKAKVVAATPGK